MPTDLTPVLATQGPGALYGVHVASAWIPFVPDPEPRPFDPVRLQEDVVRLRRHYRRQGFPAANIDYEVRADRDRRLVDVTFVIKEGPPLTLRSLTVVGPDGGEVDVPKAEKDEVRKGWQKLRSRYLGQRFREEEVTVLQNGLHSFLADHGYAHAAIEPRAVIDTVGAQVDLTWVVAPGARSQVGAIDVEGARSVPERLVARQLGFETGEWTSKANLERGRANLLTVELFRRAEVTLGGSPSDSVVPVRVQVGEDRPRFTTIEAGYVTDGAGVTGQVRWTHPNFTGGARSLNTIALFQSGWGSTSEVQDRLVRATVVLNQPYVGAPELSLGFGPQFEFRDGNIDRSAAYTLQSTLVWRFNTLQSAALRYEFTYRQVDEFRAAELTTETSSPQTLRAIGGEALLDSLSQPVRSSILSLSTSLGGLDDIARPQHGTVLKPYLSVTAPSVWGSIEFARADLQATAFAPMPGRSNSIMLRGTFGGLWPFGKSIPDPGEPPIIELVRLRDYVMTAGGANDVRGYATRMLGPKLPRIEARLSGTDTILVANGYVEYGGLRRWTGTVEFRIGIPLISRDVFGHVFGDAGRVWTTDPNFIPRNVDSDETRVFYTTGGGLGYYTPVGAIRFDVGYKLNPSVLDQREADDVLAALLAGQPASAAKVNPWRRYGFHLALGLFF